MEMPKLRMTFYHVYITMKMKVLCDLLSVNIFQKTDGEMLCRSYVIGLYDSVSFNKLRKIHKDSKHIVIEFTDHIFNYLHLFFIVK